MPRSSNNTLITQEVRDLFSELIYSRGAVLTNPVTGGRFVCGEDPIDKQMVKAQCALWARQAFARVAPPDAPMLPVSYEEREGLKRDMNRCELNYMVALYARSLEAMDYDLEAHPDWDTYASGAIAHPHLGPMLRNFSPGIEGRFSLKPLPGLNASGYYEPAGMKGMA